MDKISTLDENMHVLCFIWASYYTQRGNQLGAWGGGVNKNGG